MRDCQEILFCAGPYSVDEDTIGGIGLRIGELAELVARDWKPVILSEKSSCTSWRNIEVRRHRLQSFELMSAKAVLFFDMPIREELDLAHDQGVMIISENAAPIEQLYYSSLPDDSLHRDMLETYQRQLEISGHFVARSSGERALLVSNLRTIGRLNRDDIGRTTDLRHLISLVPLGFSAESLGKAESSMARPFADFLWTGGVWNFYHPELFVEAMNVARNKGHNFTAGFMYSEINADNQAKISNLKNLVHKLNLQDTVLFGAIRGDRDSYLKSATGFVCLAKNGPENWTAVRLRIRDSRLHGRPLVIDRFGMTADELRSDGLVVPVESTPNSVAQALIEMWELRNESRDSLSRKEYLYPRSGVQLMEFLEEIQ